MTACGDGPTSPLLHEPGIHLAPGIILADTVSSTHPLSVVVVDTSPQPAAGLVVRFESQPAPSDDDPGFSEYPVLLAADDTLPSRFRTFAAAKTDSRGRATVQVLLGPQAGAAAVIVRVAERGYVDTVLYSVEAGAAVGVTVAPGDTAIYAGRRFTLRARSADRFGNPRSDAITYAALSGPASVDGTTGEVTASGLGRAAVVARSQGLADTAYLSVVPEAWVATQQFEPGNGGPIGLFLMQLDGSGRQRLGPGLDNSFSPHGFGWSPDGRQLALGRGYFVNLLAPGGTERPILEMSGAVLPGTRFSRDGLWVYFADGGSDTQPQGLYRVSIDGTTLEHLGQGGVDYAPSPSHDGASVAYLSYRSPCGVDQCIRVLDLATNTDRAYGSQDFLSKGNSVSWSPTEDLIAYQTGLRLVLARSDGTQSRVLAELADYVKWMDWSPDGRWLIVAEIGVSLFDVQSGLRLPIGQLQSYSATVWRP